MSPLLVRVVEQFAQVIQWQPESSARLLKDFREKRHAHPDQYPRASKMLVMDKAYDVPLT